ncbi:NAD-binding protein [Roseobacter sp. YSTF-M11]|uniref:NAD-binding protein n=1 Tax=Roseobacter insulae TaxID=2859783 RepID=A0A9X1JYL7_9RHOB|nr:3-hydroxyacyl-CoA dehydrogenase NAD-binding domain-containing protein [Roseobacter insulae]MBW4708406.1 NAD-binding protein [Roseobacter insulae]
MTSETYNRVVILGAGFIGVSFAAVLADNGWQVTLVEPDLPRRDAAADGLRKQQDGIALADLDKGRGGAIDIVRSDEGALEQATLVIECGPESLDIKQEIFARLLTETPPTTLLVTASSAIPMSQIVPDPDQQSRCMVAHPVNPPAVLRLIELSPAPGTSPEAIQRAATHFADAGFEPVVLAREIEGFVLNRLQGAVLREAYRLVDDGIAEPDDIDRVMRLGLGPRWALSGPFETAELNTPGGIAAHAARLGPAYERMGEQRGETVNWSEPLVARVAAARDAARAGQSIPERAAWRSRAVARLVGLRDRLLRGDL